MLNLLKCEKFFFNNDAKIFQIIDLNKIYSIGILISKMIKNFLVKKQKIQRT